MTPARSDRVVINGRFLAQVRTGVQRYALETVCALDDLLGRDPPAATRPLNWVLAVPPGCTVPALRHIQVCTVPGGSGHAWEQWALARFTGPDYLVNLNYSGPLFKRRQLITVHDATVKAMPESFSLAYRLWHNLSVQVLGRRADAVMTVSAFSRDELRRWFGLQRSDIVVGREGAEHLTRVPEAEAGEVLRRHGLQAGCYILAVGSLKANKNVGLVARARALMSDHHLPIAVAGARDIGIFGASGATVDAAAYRFLGHVPDAELRVLYRHAACYVLPSLYEGFGLGAVEAMAHGCPVVAARVASMPEVCGDAALYVDPHDPADLAGALQRLLADGALRQRLVDAGAQRLAHYHWPANAQILFDLVSSRVSRLAGPAAARGQAATPAKP